ncbi:MAG: dTDP-4-dehydrorhamnose 3,5-epimerase [Romboutsia sp.]
MGKFNFIGSSIKGLYVIEPNVFGDDRGYFMESYNRKDFEEAGLNMLFVQDNESRSKKGVLRGMHFQSKHTQGKLVRVTYGEVYDVAIDLRYDSPTLGKWEGVILSEENKRQFYIPEGFAHGFLVLSEEAVLNYKCTDYYDKEYDSGILYNDKNIGIKWPLDRVGEIILSEKDKNQFTFEELKNRNMLF